MSSVAFSGIKVIDVLYRVSTRAQEQEGESLFNQRREVEEKWAQPNGIEVRRRIEVAESGKSALRLVGSSFVFNRRAEYTELIEEYQRLDKRSRPDAIVVDWVDRWSRNVLEYAGLVTAFRVLGIRLLAIGDGIDLTDPRNDLVAHVRAAVGQEQLRITREKIREARRSRRERGKWQGGTCPDGYRTHDRMCAGPVAQTKESPDGRVHQFSVRACNCDRTVLQRDPARESTILGIWEILTRSPLSWMGMTEAVNARGFRRPNGKPFRWNDLYRIGENPHYAGILTTDRWERDCADGTIKRRRPIRDQQMVRESDSILEPYITEEAFWALHAQRYGAQTRNISRSAKGGVSELTGLLACPECDRLMSSYIALSSKKTGHGNPRISPRKTYKYMKCAAAHDKDNPRCSNRRSVRIEPISARLIDLLAEIVAMSDESIAAAMQLRQANLPARALEAERAALTKTLTAAEDVRHTLVKLLTTGALSQDEVEKELFAHRRENMQAETRLREIDRELGQTHARPDFAKAREAVAWMRDHWDELTVPERAEALRLLVARVTFVPNETTIVETVRIIAYGKAFVQQAAANHSVVVKKRA